jgi:hypothetical protein
MKLIKSQRFGTQYIYDDNSSEERRKYNEESAKECVAKLIYDFLENESEACVEDKLFKFEKEHWKEEINGTGSGIYQCECRYTIKVYEDD